MWLASCRGEMLIRCCPRFAAWRTTFLRLWLLLEWRDFAGTGLPCGNNGGEQRKKNHCGDYVVDALVNIGHVGAQRVAQQDHAPNPEESADDVEEQVACVVHLRGAGYWRAEGADDGHEARQDDGARAVFFVKLVRAHQG